MGAAARTAALLGALVGCAPEIETLYVVPPDPQPGTLSLLLLFEDGDAPEFVVAVELDSSGAVATPLQINAAPWIDDPPSDARVAALFYRESLAELGITFGLLTGSSPARACELGEPWAALGAPLRAGAENFWAIRASELSGAERTSLFGTEPCRVRDLCRRLLARTLPIDDHDITNIVPLSTEEALVIAGASSKLYRVTRDAVLTSTVHGGFAVLSGYLDTDGELWLGGTEGGVLHGPVAGPLQPLPIPDMFHFRVAALGQRPRTGEMIALSVHEPRRYGESDSPMAAIHVLEASGWRQLYHASAERADDTHAHLIWLDEDTGLLSFSDKGVLLWDGQTIEFIAAPAGLFGELRVNGVALAADGSSYAGGSGGQLAQLVLESRRFVGVREAYQVTEIQSLIPFHEGLLIGNAGGHLAQHYPAAQLCDQVLTLGSDADAMAQMGDDVLVVGSFAAPRDANAITWVTVE